MFDLIELFRIGMRVGPSGRSRELGIDRKTIASIWRRRSPSDWRPAREPVAESVAGADRAVVSRGGRPGGCGR